MCQLCSEGFFEEYLKYVSRIQKELSRLPRGSKLWWTLSRRIMLKPEKACNIPPLCGPEKVWAFTPIAKAELMGTALSSKWDVPRLTENIYSPIHRSLAPYIHEDSFILVRRHTVQCFLSQLSENSAIGPDGICAKVLKLFCKELSIAIVKMIRRILRTGIWPECWRMHWICPLFKRGSAADPYQYRGVHFTSQVSKVFERVLAHLLIMPLARNFDIFGEH